MEKAITEYCRATGQSVPEKRGQVVRCIFESLALRYRQVLENLRSLSPRPIETLHVIGGGSRNDLLNQFTANAIGINCLIKQFASSITRRLSQCCHTPTSVLILQVAL